MCPMRVFLVLFSAMLACYLAWRNYVKTEKLSIFDGQEEQSEATTTNTMERGSTGQVCSKVSSGLWAVVDMASGRYLWNNMRTSAGPHEARTR